MSSYAVLGLGLSGRSAVSYLTARGETRIVLYVPAGEIPAAREAYPALPVKPLGSDIQEEVLVRSPGLRPDRREIRAALSGGATLTQEIELFLSACPAPVLGVTGSDGKTTTATMAARLLEEMGYRVWLGGNIGYSLLPDLPRIGEGDRVVLELSSFQLMTFAPALSAAAVTNFSENHLDWHTDMEEYRRAKRNILLGAARRVENARAPIAPELPHLSFSASLAGANYRLSGEYLMRGDEFLARADALALPGLYQRENLLCAAALTDAPATAVSNVAARFRGVPHRCEYLGEYRGVHCYDSSIDTTPTRTAATLSGLPQPLTVLCGGRNKNLSFSALSDALLRSAARVVFFGECGQEMREALLSHPAYRGVPEAAYEADFFRAAEAALTVTAAGGTLVLSPAAASFDAFSSYRARGDAFRAYLGGLGENHT